MRTLRLAVAVTGLLGLAFAQACDPFEGYFDEDSEFNAGGIDPYSFAPPYRGASAIRERAASGTFTEIGAFAKGRPVGYFRFDFSPGQVSTTNYPTLPSANGQGSPAPFPAWPEGVIDALRVSGPGTDFRQNAGNPVPVPLVYNFDPPGTENPFPEQARCAAPADYKQDTFWEGVPQDQQWNVFTFPPDRYTSFPFGTLPMWAYRPIVAEVSVKTLDMDCQAVKSERTLLKLADEGKLDVPRQEPEADKRFGRLGRPTPDKFLAWAMIDPGAAVFRVGERRNPATGTLGSTVQKYGWYGQFIVAYIDGGYIPVEDGPRVAGSPTKRMRPQRIYYPRSDVIRTGATSASPGALGQGYDVVQADRFNDGAEYSPVCEVWSYTLPPPAVKQDDLPKDEAQILQLANSTLEPARQPQSTTAYTPSVTIIPRLIFCLQAQPRPGTP